LLKAELGSKLSYPSSAAYNASVLSYWSVQDNDVDPACILSPTTTSDVSLAVGTIDQAARFGLKCPFAVRGGGHTPWAASTIANGIVIDLSAINAVSVSSDRTTTSVGPGARWIDVYLKLDAMGLATSGGRVASVGVAGLTTGGIYLISRELDNCHSNIYRWIVILRSSNWSRLRQRSKL
jgi:hypothetical protein